MSAKKTFKDARPLPNPHKSSWDKDILVRIKQSLKN